MTNWYADWLAGQGAKIREHRPAPVFGACSLLALQLARRGPVRLTLKQIEDCECRAVSAARVKRFGKLPQTNEEWDAQVSAIRADWAAGRGTEEKPPEQPPLKQDPAMTERLSELAAAHREGRESRPMEMQND